MAEPSPPQINIQSPGGNARTGTPIQSPSSVESSGPARDGRFKAGVSAESRPTSNAGLTFPNKLIRTLSSSHTNSIGPAVGAEGRRDAPTPIDPLSQRIFERTHPDNLPSQLGQVGLSGPEEPKAPEDGPPAAPTRIVTDPTLARADTSTSGGKEKRKGVSFLSRFIGSKKKDAPPDILDDDSDVGDHRAEGTDADVFRQPIGFIPRFPAPPTYIKVRSRGKKERDFNRVFLAQELRGRTGVEIAQAGGRSAKGGPVHPADKAKNGKAIWAMDFSRDGKFLAAGGHDCVVRVWGVIANEEDRLTHEKEEEAAGKEGVGTRLSAPVFKTKPVHEYEGHTASVLDLSWSKNNFLLSSAMDRTVRLWHTSRNECLCCFKHSDLVTSIQFHPRDDRFFLAGSLDSKLRLWSIPDKSVAYWCQVSDIITAVSFTPDGKTAIAGCLSGLCNFYETEGLKFQTQMHVRSAHGKNAKGSKVTGIKTINYPANDPNGEVKLVITTNDSRIRVYNLRDKGLELKLKGSENTSSQIRASFSDDVKYVICGSEDKKVYIWSTGPAEKDKDKRPVEMFEAHSAIVTAAIMAPTVTHQLLQLSGDPLYELCNPPPVTLLSRAESHSSRPTSENGGTSNPGTPLTADTTPRPTAAALKPEESPAFIARSAHPDGHIIVTADYMGRIKVFRQDCAYRKRSRNDNWETSSTISRKVLNRSSSVATRNSRTSAGRRDSMNGHPSSDRILSWRQSIERSGTGNVSAEQAAPSSPYRIGFPPPASTRSISPRKSPGGGGARNPGSRPDIHQPPLGAETRTRIKTTTATPSASAPSTTTTATTSSNPASVHHTSTTDSALDPPRPPALKRGSSDNPLMLDGAQSYMFWNRNNYSATARAPTPAPHTAQRGLGVGNGIGVGNGNGNSTDGSIGDDGFLHPRASGSGAAGRRNDSVGSAVSRLTSEFSSEGELGGGDGGGDGDETVRCARCGGENFRARVVGGVGGGVETGAGAGERERERRLECTKCGALS